MAIGEVDLQELEQQFSHEQVIQNGEDPYYWHFSDIKQVFTDDKEHGYESAAHHLRWIKKFVGKVALAGLFAAGIGGGVATVATLATTSEGALGPIPANEVTPTRDNTLTIKLAPDLSIVKPLEGKDGVGAKIVPQKIPDLSLSSPEDLTAILGGFSNGDQVVDEGEHAVWEHWKGWAVPSTITILGLMAALYISHGPSRRAELAEKLSSGRIYMGALSMCILFSSININPWDSAAAERARAIPGDPIFDQTPFKGAYFDGKLGNGARELATSAINLWRNTNSSYDNLMDDYEEKIQYYPILKAKPGTKTTLLAANLKCNTFMNRFLRRVYDNSNADLLFITADSVTGGIDGLDEFCTNALGSALRGKETAVTDGNHANKDTPALEIKNGLMVLDGKVAEISTLAVAGVSDQINSVFGTQSDHQKAFEINQKQGSALATESCNHPGGVDIVAGPNREITDPTLENGCARLGLGGDRATGLIWIKTNADGPGKGGYVPLETGANTGGVLDGQLTLGELKAPATLVLDQTDEITGELLYRQVITFFPDNSVQIGRIESPKLPDDAITSGIN